MLESNALFSAFSANHIHCDKFTYNAIAILVIILVIARDPLEISLFAPYLATTYLPTSLLPIYLPITYLPHYYLPTFLLPTLPTFLLPTYLTTYLPTIYLPSYLPSYLLIFLSAPGSPTIIPSHARVPQ